MMTRLFAAHDSRAYNL